MKYFKSVLMIVIIFSFLNSNAQKNKDGYLYSGMSINPSISFSEESTIGLEATILFCDWDVFSDKDIYPAANLSVLNIGVNKALKSDFFDVSVSAFNIAIGIDLLTKSNIPFAIYIDPIRFTSNNITIYSYTPEIGLQWWRLCLSYGHYFNRDIMHDNYFKTTFKIPIWCN